MKPEPPAPNPNFEHSPGHAGSAPVESERLAAELRIHQVELEMQNLELRETQISLEKSNQRYFALFDLAPAPYFIFSDRQEVTEMNLAAGELLGVSRTEVWHRPFSLYLSEECRPTFHRHLADVFSGRRPGPAELLLRTPLGKFRQVVIHSTLLEGAGATPARSLTACFDVTASRDLERRQRELETELRQAQKLESLGLLAGGMAHDFNNILQAITGFAELAIDETDTRLAREAMEEVRSASQRAAQLTRQILAFGRRQPIESSVWSLDQLLVSLTPMLTRLVGPGVKLRIVQNSSVPAVLADRHQMEQAIINLVVNANDAMPNGGSLELSTAFAPQALPATCASNPSLRDAVALIVHDTGVGMSQETLARVFEPFFTTKPRSHGTGLGLAVVHGIIKQHTGEIRVESQPGAGSTFTLYLPAAPAPPPSPASPADSLPLTPSPSPSPAPTTNRAPTDRPETISTGEWILLAEDEPALRRIMERLLQRRGFRVVTAANGSEAVQRFREPRPEPFSLLLFDIIMPEMNGVDAYRSIRSEPQCPPVLFVSGFSGETLLEPLGTDSVSFLRKPATEEELSREIVRLIRRANPGRESATIPSPPH